MKKFIILILLLTATPFFTTAQGPAKHRVIIDTDCAPDDLRAINLLLSSPSTEILAITSADGVLEPEEGYLKIISLLKAHGHQGIKTAQGIVSKNDAPEWRGLAKEANWGREPVSYEEPQEVKEFLIKIIEAEEQPVEIISTGPLTNIANAVLMKPSIKEQISRIIWFDQCQPEVPWTNYGMDCLSGDYLLKTPIPVFRIMTNEDPPVLSESFLDEIGKIQTPYARKIYNSHSKDTLREKIREGNFKLRDDLTAMYLYYPELFTLDTNNSDSINYMVRVKDNKNIKTKYLEHLSSYNKYSSIIFQNFPTDSNYYREDIRNFMKETIDQYGIREWRAVTLTEEFHTHLGLNSIVGAKMGTRALEYFRTQPGNLKVTSYCGHTPPLSCINDGLQVSCGTTMGQGNIKIRDEAVLPKAEFQYEDRTLQIQLKSRYYKQLQRAIKEAKKKHTFLSEAYWEAIREKSLSYWRNWDRNEIFQVSKISE
ncbi:MAG: nucleoside hydrolase [Bacteroidales bacterium]